MTTLASRIVPGGLAVREFVGVWLTLTTALIYLDVPVRESPLFATNLVLQSSIGIFVLTRLLPSIVPSILLLCGPGLVLGGALSIAIFQVVGRGAGGVVAILGIGSLATRSLTKAPLHLESHGKRWWLLGQLVGTASLAMSSKFEELLPISLFLLLGGTFTGRSSIPTRIRNLVSLLTLSLLLILKWIRPTYWWLTNDDYQFFQVLSAHITSSGPLEKWGNLDISHYHWLSYGWSGLLSFASNSTEPYIALTRVMPLAYSLAFVASTALIVEYLSKNRLSQSSMIIVTALVSVNRLDWSGTSTGGAYAVLAATIFLIAIWSNEALPNLRFFIVLGLLMSVLALTKFPSVFAAILVFSFAVVAKTTTGTQRFRKRNLIYATATLLVAGFLLVLVNLAGQISGDAFQITRINPALGQLSLFGKDFAGVALILKQLWIWVIVLYLFLLSFQIRGNHRNHLWLNWTSFTAAVLGLIFELIISANSDNYLYFAGPQYYVATLALASPLLQSSGLEVAEANEPRVRRRQNLLLGIVVLSGALWTHGQFIQGFWNTVEKTVFDGTNLKIQLLKFASSDSRLAVGVVGVLILIGAAMRGRSFRYIPTTLPIALTMLTFVNMGIGSWRSYQIQPADSAVESLLGTKSVRDVGEWLTKNSQSTDLVATNSVSDRDGGLASDFSLAVWSNREFLILGPRFFLGSAVERDRALDLSQGFAEHPTPTSCNSLLENEVKWFIIDRRLTRQSDWSICGIEKLRTPDFIVLSITDGDGNRESTLESENTPAIS